MVEKAIDFEALHKKFRDNDSASPQGQIRWLLKQGFAPNIVDEAMLMVYEEVKVGKEFINGFEFDQYLLLKARELQKKELDDHILKLEAFYGDMKKRWENEKASAEGTKKPWYKRMFG